MYFILFLILLIIIYIKSFKDSFNQEQLQKVESILLFVTIAILAIAILASIITHKG